MTLVDVQNEILPDEVAMLEVIQGSDALLTTILNVWVNKLRSMIEVGGNNLDAPGTIPDQLRPEVIAIVRWKWFSALPKTDLQSPAREKQYDEAMAVFKEIASNKPDRQRVEFPASITGGPAGQMQVASGGHKKTKDLGGLI
jgi:hypothetical protein